MKYKLIGLDIDGTLLKAHTDKPSQIVIDTIRKASKEIHISLVSARAWKDQEYLVKLLGLENNYHVLENGTKVINPSGKIEYDLYLTEDEVKNILLVSQGLFDSVGFCIEGKWLPEYKNNIVSTISFISSSRKHAEKIPAMLKKLSTSYVFSVGAHWSHPSWAVTLISHKDASKGSGLRYIQEKLHIIPEETIAVGDGASDVSTMKYAGVKVAMGNAEQEMLNVATYTAPSVDEDGIVDVFTKFMLKA